MVALKVLGLLSVAAVALWGSAGDAPAAGHPVTLHLTSFTSQTVVVHVSATPAGVQLAADTSQHFVESRTVQTPVDLRVSASADTLRLTTGGNLAILVRFTEGASAAERVLAPWGRRLMFVRVNGEFRPNAELLPAQPARTVFTDSAFHAEQCEPLPRGVDWRQTCTPRDQAVSYRKPQPW
jgi:hypothetical protein